MRDRLLPDLPAALPSLQSSAAEVSGDDASHAGNASNNDSGREPETGPIGQTQMPGGGGGDDDDVCRYTHSFFFGKVPGHFGEIPPFFRSCWLPSCAANPSLFWPVFYG